MHSITQRPFLFGLVYYKQIQGG